MTEPRPLVLERLRHVPGELLLSRDLRDQVAADAERLWWHQRAVHDATGVVAGLVVEVPKGGPVAVTPGVAYDPRGRELVVAETLSIDLLGAEAEAVPLVLVLCHREHRAPTLAWVEPGRRGRCDGVALAHLDSKAPNGVRILEPRARPVARPRFASGTTVPGATAWSPWLALQRHGRGHGLQVDVDTRSAGFAARPCYFAWLQWPAASAPGAEPGFDGFGLQHLAEETPRGFTFRVMVTPPRRLARRAPGARLARIDEDGALVTFARSERLSVAWVGLEDDHDRGGGA